MMVFGKQSTAEIVEKSSSVSSRSFHLSISERKQDDSASSQDNSSTIVTKLYPIQPDNMSLNLAARYDLSSLNRSNTVVIKNYLLKMYHFIISYFFLESNKCEKIFQVNIKFVSVTNG